MPGREDGARACGVAAFIGARVFVDDGRYFTDSSLMYELAELARQFDEFFLHCFVIGGERARDELRLPPGIRLVQLGRVRTGRDLYAHPLRLLRRIVASARRGDWSHAVLVEPGLPSLLALLVCWPMSRAAVALIRGDPAVGGIAHRHRHWLGAVSGWVLRRFRILVCWVLAHTVPVVTDSDVVASRLRQRGADVNWVAAASVSEEDVLPPGSPWLGNGRLRVLFVGRLERVKDVGTLLDALHRAAGPERHYLLQVVGAGDAEYTALLHARVRELGLDDSVEFTGPVAHGPDLYRYYQQAHVLALSSRSEGIPKVVIEAMAHGLPVIATHVGGLPGLVTPDTGILVPPADAAALSDALIMIHDSPALARRMGMAGQEVTAGLLAGPVSRQLASVVATAGRQPRLRLGLRPRRRLPGRAECPQHDACRPRAGERPVRDGTSCLPVRARVIPSRWAGLRILLPGSVANLTVQGVLVVLGLLTGIITARVLGPTLRGEFSFFILVAGILTVVGSLGAEYGMYYLWHEDHGRLRPQLLAAGAVVTALSGAFFSAVSFVAVSWLEPRTGLLLRLLVAASIPLSIANAILTMALMAHRRVAAYNVSRLAGPVAYAGVIAALWAAGALGVTSAFLAWLTALLLTVVVDVAMVARSGGGLPRWDPRVTRRSVAYGLRSYAGTVAQYGTLRLDQVLLVALAGNGALGLYYAAVSLGEAVLQIADNIGSAMLAQLGGRSREDQRHLALMTMAMAGLGTAAAASLLMAFASSVITLMLGKAYLPGLPALRILLPGSVFLAVARMMNGYFIAVGEARVFARASLAALVVTIAGDLILIPGLQADGAALASTLAYGVLLVWLGLVFRAESMRPAVSAAALAGDTNDAAVSG